MRMPDGHTEKQAAHKSGPENQDPMWGMSIHFRRRNQPSKMLYLPAPLRVIHKFQILLKIITDFENR